MTLIGIMKRVLVSGGLTNLKKKSFHQQQFLINHLVKASSVFKELKI